MKGVRSPCELMKNEIFQQLSRQLTRWLSVGVMVVFVVGAGEVDAPVGVVPEISQRINAFSIDLLKRQARGGQLPENLICSPQSIYHGLAMSYVASGGKTRAELAKALHFPEDDQALLNDLGKLRKDLKSSGNRRGSEMNMANALWFDERFAKFRPEYLKPVEKHFGASLERINFGDADNASRRINAWVSKMTKGRIKESVVPGDFASRSRPGVIDEAALVAVNAVYFKSDWGSRFDKGATRNRPFHVNGQRQVEVPMMSQSSMLRYAETDEFKWLELPYIGREYSMHVVMPKEVLRVSDLVQRLSLEKLMAMPLRSFPCEVDVWFPRFELSSQVPADALLADMGVKDAFHSGKADFDRMIVKAPEADRIYLSKIRHDAWIEVNEKGSEAAAATSTMHFSIGCSAPMMPRKVEFHADRPFVFLIVHNESRSVLFTGWVTNPTGLAK